MFPQFRPAEPRLRISAADCRPALIRIFGTVEVVRARITNFASGSSTTSLELAGQG